MPFEGLNFGLARPTVPLESPMDAYSKALQLQQLQQHGQLQNLQLLQQTAAMERENAFRQGLQGAGNDPQKIQDLLTRTGKFKEAQEYAKSLKDTEAARVNLQNEYLKHDDLERKQLQDMTQTSGSAAMAAMQIKDPTARAQAWQEALPRLAQQFQPTQTDSPRMAQIKQNMIQQLQAEAQGLGNMTGPQDLDALLNKHVNDAKTHADWMKEAEQERANKKVAGFHPAIGPDNKPGIFQYTAGGDVRQVPGLKPVPAGNGGHGGMGGAEPLQDAAWNIAHYKSEPPSARSKNYLQLMTEVRKIREAEGLPPYDQNQWIKVKRSNEYFSGTGKGATTLTSNDVLFGHADEVLESLHGANLNDTRVINAVEQWYSRQTGQDARFKNLKVAATVFGSELSRMLGEDAQEERKATKALFDNVDSPASFIAAVKQSQKMAATRSAGLANQYFRETGLDPVDAGILPDRVGRAAVNTVAAGNYAWAAKHRGNGGGTEQPQPSSGGQWQSRPPAGSPDMATLGKNPRFKNAVWVGKDAPDGGGWYVREGGQIRRVE